jgi:hypothetical protein
VKQIEKGRVTARDSWDEPEMELGPCSLMTALQNTTVQRPGHNIRDLVCGLGLDTWLIAGCIELALYSCGLVMLFSKDAVFPDVLAPWLPLCDKN